MNKKKILGTTLALLIGLTSAAPVFAADSASTDTTTSSVAAQNKNRQCKQGRYSNLTLEERAEKPQFNLEEKAAELGIDISDLSQDEARSAVRDAMKASMGEKHQAKLEERASELGIDTTGLSQDEIKSAIREGIGSKGIGFKHGRHNGSKASSADSSSTTTDTSETSTDSSDTESAED